MKHAAVSRFHMKGHECITFSICISADPLRSCRAVQPVAVFYMDAQMIRRKKALIADMERHRHHIPVMYKRLRPLKRQTDTLPKIYRCKQFKYTDGNQAEKNGKIRRLCKHDHNIKGQGHSNDINRQIFHRRPPIWARALPQMPVYFPGRCGRHSRQYLPGRQGSGGAPPRP